MSAKGTLGDYLAIATDGQYYSVDDINLNLTQGSGRKIPFRDNRTGNVFESYISNFCRGNRPRILKGTIKEYLETAEDGCFITVDEENSTLGQGSSKFIEFTDSRTGEKFKNYVYNFCKGVRPLSWRSKGTLSESDIFQTGNFDIDPENDNLTQGSHELIEIRVVSTDYVFTAIVRDFCARSCHSCGARTEKKYHETLCFRCYADTEKKTPYSNFDHRRKAELTMYRFLSLKMKHIKWEWDRPTNFSSKYRFDFWNKESIYVEVDGTQHFKWVNSFGHLINPGEVQSSDALKMKMAFQNDPKAVFVRIRSMNVFGKVFPFNRKKPVLFDWPSALYHVYKNRSKFYGSVVFIEPSGDSSYDTHKEQLTADGRAWFSVSPDQPGVRGLLKDIRKKLFRWSTARHSAI
jgi:hypothetical protein